MYLVSCGIVTTSLNGCDQPFCETYLMVLNGVLGRLEALTKTLVNKCFTILNFITIIWLITKQILLQEVFNCKIQRLQQKDRNIF